MMLKHETQYMLDTHKLLIASSFLGYWNIKHGAQSKLSPRRQGTELAVLNAMRELYDLKWLLENLMIRLLENIISNSPHILYPAVNRKVARIIPSADGFTPRSGTDNNCR